MKFIVAEKKSPNGLILIITDKKIIGKKFKEGKKQLDLTQNFYRGEAKSKKEARELIKGCYILHLTGDKAVALGGEIGLVEKKEILRVQNIPHAEVLLEG